MDGPSAEHLCELVDRATRRPDMDAHRALRTALGSAPPAALEVQKALRRVLLGPDPARQVLAANLLHSLIQSCPSLRLAVSSSRDWHELLAGLVASPQTHMQLRSNIAKMLQSAARSAASDITYQPFATLWNSLVQRGLVRVVPPQSTASASAPPPPRSQPNQQSEGARILAKHNINLAAVKTAEAALRGAMARGDLQATGTQYAIAVEAERDAAEQRNKLVAERRKIQLALGTNQVLAVPELVTRLIDANTRINAVLEEHALFAKRCARVCECSDSSISFLPSDSAPGEWLSSSVRAALSTALSKSTIDPATLKQYNALVSRIQLPKTSAAALVPVHPAAVVVFGASPPETSTAAVVRDVLLPRPAVRRRSAYGLREAYHALFGCECL